MAARFDVWCPSTKCCSLDVSCGHQRDRPHFLPVGDAGSDNEVPPDRPEESPGASEPKARCSARGVPATNLQACVEELKKDLHAELADTVEELRSELRSELRAGLGEQLAGQGVLAELLARQRDEQASMQDLDQALLAGVEKLAQGQDIMKRTMELADLDRRVAALEQSPPGVLEGQLTFRAEAQQWPQTRVSWDSTHETRAFIEHVEETFRAEIDRISEINEARLSALRGLLADHAEEHARTARQDAKLRRELSRIHGDLRAHRMAIRCVSEQFGTGTELLPDTSQTVQKKRETLEILEIPEIPEIPETAAHYCISSPHQGVESSETAEDETTPREVVSFQEKCAVTSLQEMCLRAAEQPVTTHPHIWIKPQWLPRSFHASCGVSSRYRDEH